MKPNSTVHIILDQFLDHRTHSSIFIDGLDFEGSMQLRRFDFDRLTTFVVQHLTNWSQSVFKISQLRPDFCFMFVPADSIAPLAKRVTAFTFRSFSTIVDRAQQSCGLPDGSHSCGYSHSCAVLYSNVRP